MADTQMQAIQNVSRRSVLSGIGAGLVLMVVDLPSRSAFASDPPVYGAAGDDNGWRSDPKLFVSIDDTGLVTLVNHRQEMGQGIKTSLALIMADELEADFQRVQVIQADGDEIKWGNQDTDGSRSMRHGFVPMRTAGAAARVMLEAAAAAHWGVPHGDVRAINHQLIHVPTGRKLSFGAVAVEAAKLPVPDLSTLQLKTPSQYRYIGKDVVRGVDLVAITTGVAKYGIDISVPGLMYAVVARPPVVGGTVKTYDATAALKLPGVLKVIPIGPPPVGSTFQPLGGIAVIAESTWSAIKGREVLVVEWNDGPNGDYNSGVYRDTLRATVRQPGTVVHSFGDVDAALASAKKRVEAEYYVPHLAHATMEPPSATARVELKGQCEVWASVQAPQDTKDAIASALGIKSESVIMHVTLIGGGFGRKAMPDFAVEAAILSKSMGGQPVKVIWTREDDIKHDYYHTVSMERLEAGLDKSGAVIAWRHRSAAPTIDSNFGPDTLHESASEIGQGLSNFPFAVPAVRLENPAAAARTRIGQFRAVSNVPHAFAIQSFVAELAETAKEDPKDFLLKLIGPPRKIDPTKLDDTYNYGESPVLYPIDTGRLRRVVERAAAGIAWQKSRRKGQGLGIAGHYSFVTYTACAVEVSVSPDGNVTVSRVDIAIDCGTVVNPDQVRAQAEGSVIMGLGLCLSGEITFQNGRVEQGNFNDYSVLRIDSAPRQIVVHLVKSNPSGEIGGVGEPCLPPVAPALCNAIFAATGRRIRELPVRNQIKT